MPLPRLLLLLSATTLSLAQRNANSSSSIGQRSFGPADEFTCVSGCTCTQVDFTRSRYAVVCSGSGIRGLAFLTEDLHQIESMTLTRTSIAQIDSLRLFSGLTYLNLSQSLVQTLDFRLASTFPALESLHLADGRLKQVSDLNLIKHLTMREVDFSNNQLTDFDRSGSMSLRSLSLRRNLMEDLNDLGAGYSALRRLDASENRLSLEGLHGWDPPADLEVLDLSGNQLKSGAVNATFLWHLPQLQQLILRNNKLDSLSPIVNSLLPGAKLWKLSLAGNPFACTCALYRDKERLATQGVIITDSPICRLPNGTEYSLTRLGSWACLIDGGGGTGGGSGSSGGGGSGEISIAGLSLPAGVVYSLIALAVVVTLALAACGVVCACRRSGAGRDDRVMRPRSFSQQPQQELEYPYNNSSVKSTNLTGSQLSVRTCRSAVPLSYGLDPQRSRVFTKKQFNPEQLMHQAMMGPRSQSEQVLGGTRGWGSVRGSHPLPPIPDAVLRANAELQGTLRPEGYVEMNVAEGYQEIVEPPATTYEELQQVEQRAHRRPLPPPPLSSIPPLAVPEGYVEMNSTTA